MVRRLARGVLVLVGLVVLAAVGVATWWVVTWPDAEAGPVAAVEDDERLTVVRADGVVTLRAVDGGSDAAVVFVPGAGVPPDAYLPTWAPIVRRTGVTVHVPDVPLRLAILDRGVADDVRARYPTTGEWWLGGHSLGGTVAAMAAAASEAGAWDGIVLWASYPSSGSSLADRDDLAVLSVAGTEDGLSTPADIAGTRDLLPPGAVVEVLDGVTHAQFGAYGLQRGDGTPAVSDEDATAEIAEVTAAWLAPG